MLRKVRQCAAFPITTWAQLTVTLISRGLASTVESETLGHVRLIAINRPHKKNAINRASAVLLKQALTDFAEDRSVTAAVLYGKGGTFCSGYDLQELASSEAASVSQILSGTNGPMGPTRYFCPKPIIAAIEGYAVAGGLELALMCDLRVMDETSVIGIFNRRFGVPLIDGGTVRLPALIGLSRALDLILTGREIRAKEALEFGLINRICDTGTAVGRALLLAQEMSKFPQECLKADRLSAYHSTFAAQSFQEACDFELRNGLHVIEKESIKGAKRFVEGVGKHGSFNIGKPVPDV